MTPPLSPSPPSGRQAQSCLRPSGWPGPLLLAFFHVCLVLVSGGFHQRLKPPPPCRFLGATGRPRSPDNSKQGSQGPLRAAVLLGRPHLLGGQRQGLGAPAAGSKSLTGQVVTELRDWTELENGLEETKVIQGTRQPSSTDVQNKQRRQGLRIQFVVVW